MALQISKALGGHEMCAAEIEPSLARGIESPVQRAGPHSWKLDRHNPFSLAEERHRDWRAPKQQRQSNRNLL